MSESNSDQKLWDFIDDVIALANERAQSEDGLDIGQISEALAYASSRFSVFLAANNSLDRKIFKEEVEDIKAQLLERYESMLSSNLDDYLENYKIYIEKERPSSDE